MPPLVSFLIPAYNAESHLADTIRSVLVQTWTRIEIIVVNDGSRDATLAVARSFADPRVKVIDQENRGQSATENRAFRESQGDYIVYLDADDLISPQKVENQVRRLADAEPGCIAFGRWGRFYDRVENVKYHPELFWRDISPIDFHVELWTAHSLVQGACYLLPRQMVETAGGWDEQLSLANDFPYFPRILMQARRLLFCPDAILYYRSGLASALSGRKTPQAWASAYKAVLSGTTYLRSFEDSQRVRLACCRQYEEFVYASYPLVSELRTNIWRLVRELGGPYFSPQMGPKTRALSRLIGWKATTRLKSWINHLTRQEKI